ncbi:Splicing factor U2AF-associated protein 2 [Stagonosporopsis vannaccii]|nr:Splicing factor U2AF-associated protein 2 [Stagonosporopsis vannaccii]
MTHEIVDNPLSEADIVASDTPLNVQTDTANKKRKNPQDFDVSKKPKVQENRAIYVTNLPRDTNEHEIENEFKKYGIIDQGADGNKRIKMYKDDEGNFNGDCLIVYFKKESVDLAIRMMDNYFFRIEDQSQGMIRVKEADFSYKKHKDGDEIASKLTRKDKKASERNRAELNRYVKFAQAQAKPVNKTSKLAEWSDNEEEVAETFAPKKNKWAKVCILRHAFTLDELDEDEEAILDIKEEMREEGEKFGEVTNVTLYDKEEDGIIAVRFKEFDSAEKFKNANNGRMFAKRKLEVTLAEDKPKFKKSARGEEPDSDEEERNLEKLTRQK